MKFKNIHILSLCFCTILIFIIATGCEEVSVGNDFLSKPPELDFTRDSAFANAARAKEVLWNAYATLPQGIPKTRSNGSIPGERGGIGWAPQWGLTDLIGDGEPWDALTRYWGNGTYNADIASRFHPWFMPDKYDWIQELGWEGIRDSYIFLENVDQVPNMSASEKARLKAEAKMIVATHYVQLFRHYGGILYVNHAYKPDEDFHLERLTVMQTVDTLTSIIDDARKDLPFELDNPAQWSGRFTAAGAMALKVKLLSFAAPPLLNSNEAYMAGEAASEKLVWTGGYKRSLWERLRDASKELIDRIEGSAYYGMVNTGNPRADYRSAYYDRGTGETLLSFRLDYDFKRNGAYVFLNDPWNGFAVPLHNYAMKFPMKNGKSVDDPSSGYDPENPYVGRDPRFYETLKVNGGKHGGRKIELWIGGRERKNKRRDNVYTGYKLRKWRLDNVFPYGKIMQWPYMRIPEVFFAYAEALNELNGGPTPEAFRYVNKVRERVNVGPIEEYIGKPQNQITKQEFLDAVLNERAIELGCEDNRWFDMIRYKLKDVFTAENYAMDTTLKDAAKQKSDFTSFFQDSVDFSEHSTWFNYDITAVDKGALHWRDNFSPKWFFSAFPSVEVQKGYGLIQNPGWETSASDGN